MASSVPSQPRLLAIIELQNAIAAAAMNADEVMHIVAERAGTLTSAEAALVALVEGDELIYRAVIAGRQPASWTTPSAGTRVAKAASVAGRCVAEGRPLRLDD